MIRETRFSFRFETFRKSFFFHNDFVSVLTACKKSFQLNECSHMVHMVRCKQEGLVEGIVKGKEQVAQAAFNEGYEAAFKCIFQVNLLKGAVR